MFLHGAQQVVHGDALSHRASLVARKRLSSSSQQQREFLLCQPQHGAHVTDLLSREQPVDRSLPVANFLLMRADQAVVEEFLSTTRTDVDDIRREGQTVAFVGEGFGDGLALAFPFPTDRTRFPFIQWGFHRFLFFHQAASYHPDTGAFKQATVSRRS